MSAQIIPFPTAVRRKPTHGVVRAWLFMKIRQAGHTEGFALEWSDTLAATIRDRPEDIAAMQAELDAN